MQSSETRTAKIILVIVEITHFERNKNSLFTTKNDVTLATFIGKYIKRAVRK